MSVFAVGARASARIGRRVPNGIATLAAWGLLNACAATATPSGLDAGTQRGATDADAGVTDSDVAGGRSPDGGDGAAIGEDSQDTASFDAPNDSPAAETDQADGAAASPATFAFPGGLALAAPLRVTITSLLSNKTGCDWDDDGTPNNVMGQLMQVYPAFGDSLSSSALTCAWLASSPIANLPEGATFTASSHFASVDESGALWLHENGVKAGGGGAEPMHILHGLKGDGGAFELTWSQKPGQAAWSLALAGVTELGQPLMPNLVVRAVRINAIPKAGGFGGMICVALDLGAGDGAALLKPDLDVDGDGYYDSVSAAFAFDASSASVAGISW